jgi:hypothetical protein
MSTAVDMSKKLNLGMLACNEHHTIQPALHLHADFR